MVVQSRSIGKYAASTVIIFFFINSVAYGARPTARSNSFHQIRLRHSTIATKTDFGSTVHKHVSERINKQRMDETRSFKVNNQTLKMSIWLTQPSKSSLKLFQQPDTLALAALIKRAVSTTRQQILPATEENTNASFPATDTINNEGKSKSNHLLQTEINAMWKEMRAYDPLTSPNITTQALAHMPKKIILEYKYNPIRASYFVREVMRRLRNHILDSPDRFRDDIIDKVRQHLPINESDQLSLGSDLIASLLIEKLKYFDPQELLSFTQREGNELHYWHSVQTQNLDEHTGQHPISVFDYKANNLIR